MKTDVRATHGIILYIYMYSLFLHLSLRSLAASIQDRGMGSLDFTIFPVGDDIGSAEDSERMLVDYG